MKNVIEAYKERSGIKHKKIKFGNLLLRVIMTIPNLRKVDLSMILRFICFLDLSPLIDIEKIEENKNLKLTDFVENSIIIKYDEQLGTNNLKIEANGTKISINYELINELIFLLKITNFKNFENPSSRHFILRILNLMLYSLNYLNEIKDKSVKYTFSKKIKILIFGILDYNSISFDYIGFNDLYKLYPLIVLKFDDHPKIRDRFRKIFYHPQFDYFTTSVKNQVDFIMSLFLVQIKESMIALGGEVTLLKNFLNNKLRNIENSDEEISPSFHRVDLFIGGLFILETCPSIKIKVEYNNFRGIAMRFASQMGARHCTFMDEFLLNWRDLIDIRKEMSGYNKLSMVVYMIWLLKRWERTKK